MFRFILSTFVMIFCARGLADESPYEKFSTNDVILLGVTGLGGGIGVILEHNMAPLTPEQAARLDRNDVNRFDRPATFNLSEHAAKLSDYGMRTSLLLPLGLLFDADIRRDSHKIAYLYLETMAVTGVLTELTKVSIQRFRPWAYNEDVPLERKKGKDVKKAFFSGHASASFAGAVFFAKVFNDYYPDGRLTPYVWAGSLTVASAVAYWRVRAGRHFPSDVIAGALVGGAVAYLIPELHKNEQAEMTTLAPTAQPMMIGFSLHF